MAYLRGETYIWSSDAGVHFWTKEGKEDLAEHTWSEGSLNAGGIRLGFKESDEFAILRFTEMLEEKDKSELISEIEKIISENGNFGANPIKENKEKIFRLINDYYDE